MATPAAYDAEVCEQPLTRVLYVEDDETIARATATVLRRDGYEVVSVASAEQAIGELKAHRFDVVLSDFNLAGPGNGADVLAFAGPLPFVFLTGDDRADHFGVTRLEKPSSPAAIRDALHQALLTRSA